jgi:CRP/FNR family transcriptional regulator, anaerobic regulatory protein
METLLFVVSQIITVSSALRTAIIDSVKQETFKRKDFLLSPDAVSNKIYFIESGLARGFYLKHTPKDSKDITSWLMKENEFIISIVSFYSRQPSYEYIEALEDITAWSISHERIEQLYRSFPEFNAVGRVLTEKYYVQSERRAYYLRTQTAEERLRSLLGDFPTIFIRVKHHHVASLLGIEPETLSRAMKKKI